MFTTGLFTIAKTWKQIECPSTDAWIKKHVEYIYIYTHIYTYIYVCTYVCTYKYVYIYIYDGILLNHEKEWDNAICSNMNGPKDYHIEWSKGK